MPYISTSVLVPSDDRTSSAQCPCSVMPRPIHIWMGTGDLGQDQANATTTITIVPPSVAIKKLYIFTEGGRAGLRTGVSFPDERPLPQPPVVIKIQFTA